MIETPLKRKKNEGSGEGVILLFWVFPWITNSSGTGYEKNSMEKWEKEENISPTSHKT